MNDIETTTKAVNEVYAELQAARSKFPAFNGPHEGYAVILEELDELWDEIKHQTANHDRVKMRSEAKQVAAMALRFMIDLT